MRKAKNVKLIKKVPPNKTKLETATKNGENPTTKAVGLECAPVGASHG